MNIQPCINFSSEKPVRRNKSTKTITPVTTAKITNFLNKGQLPNGHVYVGAGFRLRGRRFASELASPYSTGRDGSKASAMYKAWLWEHMKNGQSRQWLIIHQMAMQVEMGAALVFVDNPTNISAKALADAVNWLAQQYTEHGVGNVPELQ